MTLKEEIKKLEDWATTHRVSPLTKRDFGKIDMAKQALSIIKRQEEVINALQAENEKEKIILAKVGNKLRIWRLSQNMGLRDFAVKIGVSASELSSVEAAFEKIEEGTYFKCCSDGTCNNT